MGSSLGLVINTVGKRRAQEEMREEHRHHPGPPPTAHLGPPGNTQLYSRKFFCPSNLRRAHPGCLLATAVSSRKDPLAVYKDTTTAQVFAMEQPHLPRLGVLHTLNATIDLLLVCLTET